MIANRLAYWTVFYYKRINEICHNMKYYIIIQLELIL